MSWTNRSLLPLAVATLGMAAWPGCETHVTTDSPPPRVDVQVEKPAVDVDVTRKPGVDVDVDVKRNP